MLSIARGTQQNDASGAGSVTGTGSQTFDVV